MTAISWSSLKKIKFSNVGRIRVVVGASAICLGWMEYLSPSVSSKWDWIKRLAMQAFGESGFISLLMVIGFLFIAWALIDAVVSLKGENK